MSKYEENHGLLSDLKDAPKNILDFYVAGANQNLKLSEYYILDSQCQIYELHKELKETATEKL